MRKSFTISERVAIAMALVPKYEGRQLANLKQNRVGNISHSAEEGRSTDIVAAKVGLGSGKTYEAAQRVVMEGAPELVKAMDEGAR